MKKSLLFAATALAIGFGAIAAGPLGSGAARAEDAAASMSKSDVEKIVRDYLVANPEILEEMQAALDAKHKEAERIAQTQTIQDNKAELFASVHDGIVGNPDGKVSIVEFYDYNCGFCKRALEDMQALTAADPDLRFVLKEFPILGPDSQKAHIVASAFQRLMPEKYAEFHNRFLGGQGRATEASAMKLALELGADEAKLREEMKDPAIGDNFSKTYELANKLAITGTPSYVVGNEVVFGALGKDVLEQKIAAARACGDTGNC
ncbi:MAG: DsbA family protein [Rhizobiales bacterium]|nr:DsbA family protein [Hyphomicrobiales bacterium]